MVQENKPHIPKPGPLAAEEANDEIMNDSLGTVDLADTADTDPDDDPATKEGISESNSARHKSA
jgi:hypothetical protein